MSQEQEALDRSVPLKEAIRIIGVSRTSLYKLVSLGKLSKPIHPIGNKSCWPYSELKKFQEDRKREREKASGAAPLAIGELSNFGRKA